MMLGVFHARMRFTSTVVASVLYALFTIGRALSLALDGMPADTLVKATVVEGIVAAAAIFALVKYRESRSA